MGLYAAGNICDLLSYRASRGFNLKATSISNELDRRLSKKLLNSCASLPKEDIDSAINFSDTQLASQNISDLSSIALFMISLPAKVVSFGVSIGAIVYQDYLLLLGMVIGITPTLINRFRDSYEDNQHEIKWGGHDARKARIWDQFFIGKAFPAAIIGGLTKNIANTYSDLSLERDNAQIEHEKGQVRRANLADGIFVASELAIALTLIWQLSSDIPKLFFLLYLVHERLWQFDDVAKDIQLLFANLISMQRYYSLVNRGSTRDLSEAEQDQNYTDFPIDYNEISFKDVVFESSSISVKIDDFTVPCGGLVILKGSSGAGKTTFLESLAAKKRVLGYLKIGGVDLNEISLESWRNIVGYAAVVPSNLDGFTVDEVLNQRSLKELPQHAWDVLNRLFKRTPNYRQQIVGVNLGGFAPSQGQQAALNIFRAAKECRLLYLDEPTANLDRKLTLDVLTAVNLLRSSGITVFLATHSDVFNSSASVVVKFKNGHGEVINHDCRGEEII
jgi:ABC-type multidrug transport system fused ATPase/permease subunit